MDYNKLKTFVELANTGSVTLTAEKLFRTQSAISQQLQSLESQLNLILFERKKSRIYLTNDGERLYNFAKQRFQEIDDELIRILDDSNLVEGEIKIGILPEFSINFLPTVLSQFQAKFKKVRFRLYQASDNQIEELLLNNKIDFGFVVSLEHSDMFLTNEVMTKQMMAVASKEYLSKHSPINDFKDLKDHSLIEFGENFLSFGTWLKYNYKKSVLDELKKRKATMIIEDDIGIKEMVLHHLGIGILPSYLIQDELESGELVPVLNHLNADAFLVKVLIATRKTRTKDLLMGQFYKFVTNSKN
ncbi:MAG: LysR family transcriptional regulator [Candidatus Cloacimonetes bacterium]|nr:LysR family transcriptional regulator [Candidatus Cloacimonadota bacterium]